MTSFDLTAEPKPPRPTGLSARDKAWLAVALAAVLGAVGFVADALSARDGYTPASGFDEVARHEAQDDSATPPGAAPDAQGTEAGLDEAVTGVPGAALGPTNEPIGPSSTQSTSSGPPPT